MKHLPDGFKILIKSLQIVSLSVMIYLVLALFLGATPESIKKVLTDGSTLSAIKISIITMLISMSCITIIGILLAYSLRHKKNRKSMVLHGLIIAPILLPPTVVGLTLLQGFGRNSMISHWLFGGKLGLAFSPAAIVITQIFVGLPYFYQMTRRAFEEVDRCYIEAASVNGANGFQILRHILLPMSQTSIMAGILLSGLRGLAEFGATMMFAGNMEGRTQTVTLRIYQLYQSEPSMAMALALCQMVLILLPYLLVVRKFGTGDLVTNGPQK